MLSSNSGPRASPCHNYCIAPRSDLHAHAPCRWFGKFRTFAKRDPAPQHVFFPQRRLLLAHESHAWRQIADRQSQRGGSSRPYLATTSFQRKPCPVASATDSEAGRLFCQSGATWRVPSRHTDTGVVESQVMQTAVCNALHSAQQRCFGALMLTTRPYRHLAADSPFLSNHSGWASYLSHDHGRLQKAGSVEIDEA